MKHLSFIFIFIGGYLSLSAQNIDPWSLGERRKFAESTFQNGDFKTSLKECQFLLESPSLNQNQMDSLHFLSAQNLFMMDQREAASLPYSKISHQPGPLFFRAGLYLNYKYLMTGKPEMVRELNRELFQAGEIEREQDQPLPVMTEAAACLLMRDFQAFDSLSEKAYTGDAFEAFMGMKKAKDAYQNKRKKSPFLAGAMSFILPGTGKIYAGNIGSGISTFFFTGIAGLQAWEGFRRDGGWKSPQFLAFSGLAAAWYLSGIYGAVIHAKRYNAVIETDFRDAVLLSVSMPLERFFAR